MKEFLTILKDWGILPCVYIMGWIGWTLFGLSLIPSLNFVPKLVLFYILTH